MSAWLTGRVPWIRGDETVVNFADFKSVCRLVKAFNCILAIGFNCKNQQVGMVREVVRTDSLKGYIPYYSLRIKRETINA